MYTSATHRMKLIKNTHTAREKGRRKYTHVKCKKQRACMSHYQRHFCCVNKIASVFFSGGKFIIYLICLFCVSITLTSLAFFSLSILINAWQRKNNNNNSIFYVVILVIVDFSFIGVIFNSLLLSIYNKTYNKPHLYI